MRIVSETKMQVKISTSLSLEAARSKVISSRISKVRR